MHRVGGCDIRVEGKNGNSFHEEWRINQSLSMPRPACQKSATKMWTLSPPQICLTSYFFVLPGTGRLHLTVSSHWSLSFLKASRFEVVPKIALEASQSPVFLSVTVFSLDWRTLGQFSSVQVGSCHLAEALEGLMVAAAAGGGGGSIRPDRGSHVATSAPHCPADTCTGSGHPDQPIFRCCNPASKGSKNCSWTTDTWLS